MSSFTHTVAALLSTSSSFDCRLVRDKETLATCTSDGSSSTLDLPASTPLGTLDEKTVFVVGTRCLANVESTVHAGGKASAFAFRNPPHFVSFVPAQAAARDVADEVDALLRHLFAHMQTHDRKGITISGRA